MVDSARENLGRLAGGRADGELGRLLLGGDWVSEDVFEELFECEIGNTTGDGARSHRRRCGVVCRADGSLALFSGDSVSEDVFEDIFKEVFGNAKGTCTPLIGWCTCWFMPTQTP